jgi:hypothetical protein
MLATMLSNMEALNLGCFMGREIGCMVKYLPEATEIFFMAS